MSQHALTFVPLDLSMTESIYQATYGNVASYFHPFSNLEAATTWTKNALEEIKDGEKIEYAVFSGDKFVGLISLRDLKTETPEFGLWIHPEHQGKGYGVQSVKWLIDWATSNLNAKYLIYDAEKANEASNRLAIAAGLDFEKEYREGENIYIRYLWRIQKG